MAAAVSNGVHVCIVSRALYLSDSACRLAMFAPVVKRISQQSSELLFQVRILAGAPSE